MLLGRRVLALMGTGRDTLGPLQDAEGLLASRGKSPCSEEDNPDAMALEGTFACGAGLPGH